MLGVGAGLGSCLARPLAMRNSPDPYLQIALIGSLPGVIFFVAANVGVPIFLAATAAVLIPVMLLGLIKLFPLSGRKRPFHRSTAGKALA